MQQHTVPESQTSQSYDRPSQRPSHDPPRCFPRDVSPTCLLPDAIFHAFSQMPFSSCPRLLLDPSPTCFPRTASPQLPSTRCLFPDVSSQNHPPNALSQMIPPRCFRVPRMLCLRCLLPDDSFYMSGPICLNKDASSEISGAMIRQRIQPNRSKRTHARCSQSTKMAQSGYHK